MVYSRKVLQYLVALQPGRGLYWFNYGNILLLSHEHREAVAAYRKVVELGSPLAPAAWLYAAKCYRLMGVLQYSASAHLALQRLTLPPNLAVEAQVEKALLVQALEARAAEAYRVRDFNGSGRLIDALEAIGAMSQEARAVRGILAERGEEPAVQERHGGALQLSVNSGFDSNPLADANAENPARAPVIEVAAAFERDLGAHSAVLGGIQVTERVGLPQDRLLRLELLGSGLVRAGNVRLLFYPLAHGDFLGSSPYLPSFGGGVGAEGGERNTVGVFLRVLRNIPLHDEAAHLLGYDQLRKLYLAMNRESFSAMLSLMDRVDGGLDLSLPGGVLPLAGRATGPGVSWTWRAGAGWELNGFASYFFRSFDRLVQPTREQRLDRQLEAGARIARQLAAGTAAQISVNYLRNRSTLGGASLDDNNYSQWILKGGVSWQTSW
ncbi:MAG: hypothetical protein NDJ90_01910 [Oligoflexia bacterium]|nr:hypothetical protein [Oligoflexia bacterium]